MMLLGLVIALLWNVGQTSATSVETDGFLSEERIVGGKLSANHGRPYMALMIFYVPVNTGFVLTICGANVLNEYWLVTVAHCKPSSAINYTLHLGMNDWCNGIDYVFSDGHIERKIDQFIPHPDYDKVEIENDIALIKMDQPVPLGTNIKAIQLPSREPIPGELMSVAGWGLTGKLGQRRYSCFLQEVKVKVIPDTICMPLIDCDANFFCALWDKGGKDSCKGDSGGGLVTNTTNGFVLHGLVNLGEGCGIQYEPGFYVRVINYKAWIEGYLSL